MHKVRIVIEVETEWDEGKVLDEFKSGFDFWPGGGLYIDPWESAKVMAETITEK